MKTDRAKITLSPDKEYNEGVRVETPVMTVGFLQLYEDRLDAYLNLPDDTLPSVISALDAKAIRYATLRGEKLRYRKGLVHDYSFDRTYEEDDFSRDKW